MILSMKMALCVRPPGMETKEIPHLGPALTPALPLWGFETASATAPILTIAKSQHCSSDSSTTTQQLKHGDCSYMPVRAQVHTHTLTHGAGIHANNPVTGVCLT